MEIQSHFRQLVGYDLAKRLSEQALTRANRVEKSLKIIKRTCSSIRDLRVAQINQSRLTKTIVFSAYSSNTALSDRLDEYSSDHKSKISIHASLLDDLDQNHQRTAGRVENVASQVGSLKTDVNHMEGRLRGEVKSKVSSRQSRA